MNHTAAVRVADGFTHPVKRTHEGAKRSSAFGAGRAFTGVRERCGQGRAADLLHGEPRSTVVHLPPVVDGHHPWVLQERGDGRLAPEPRDSPGVVQVLPGQHLHGDVPIHQHVECPPDLGEPTARQGPSVPVSGGEDAPDDPRGIGPAFRALLVGAAQSGARPLHVP